MRYWPNRQAVCARMVRIEPDIAMVAKGIGGGFPLGAVLAKTSAAAE